MFFENIDIINFSKTRLHQKHLMINLGLIMREAKIDEKAFSMKWRKKQNPYKLTSNP
jgi:hypothetical protein